MNPIAWPARGAWRAARALYQWAAVTDPLHRQALEAASTSPAAFIRMENEQKETRTRRAATIIAATITIAAAPWIAGLFDLTIPAWGWAAAAAALLAAATIAGIHEPAQPTRPAPETTRRHGPTPETITAALAAAVPELARTLKDDPDAIRCITPPTRDGNGWATTLELPPGITAATIAGAREKLSSAFHKPALAISVEPDPGHAGMLTLWLGDKPPEGPAQWRIGGPVDVLEQFPIGEDLRGRPVTITLRNQNGLIGAMTRYGKTFTMRVILLAAALDPRVEMYVYELKGSDLLPLELVAKRVVCGDDDEDVAQLLADLRTVRAEITRRNKVIRALPRDRRTDGQMTSADATRLGMPPIIFAIDEAHLAYANKTYGREIAELAEDVFRRGGSVGIIVLMATQNFNKESVPRTISTNAGLRMCGKVESYVESNMVLGSNAHSAGISATVFGPEDRGVFWLRGAGDPTIVRVAKVDSAQAWAIAEQAAAARPQPDTDTDNGQEGEEPVDVAPTDLLGRVLAAWPEHEPRLHTAEIFERLKTAHPGDYDDWTAEAMSRELPADPKRFRRGELSRWGYHRDHLTTPSRTGT